MTLQSVTMTSTIRSRLPKKLVLLKAWRHEVWGDLRLRLLADAGGTRGAAGVAMRQCHAALWSNSLGGIAALNYTRYLPQRCGTLGHQALLRDSDIKLALS